MLFPSNRKFRKERKGRIKGLAKGGCELAFGQFALKALEPERITSRQIEAARRAITRYLRRTGKLIIRIFPHVPVTAKPAEVRMGKGKGDVDRWVAKVQPGRILFELDAVTEDMAREAFNRGAAKLPISTKFISNIDA